MIRVPDYLVGAESACGWLRFVGITSPRPADINRVLKGLSHTEFVPFGEPPAPTPVIRAADLARLVAVLTEIDLWAYVETINSYTARLLSAHGLPLVTARPRVRHRRQRPSRAAPAAPMSEPSEPEGPVMALSVTRGEDGRESLALDADGVPATGGSLAVFASRRLAVAADMIDGPASPSIGSVLVAEVMRGASLLPILVPARALGHADMAPDVETPFVVPLPWPTLSRLATHVRRAYPDTIFRVWTDRTDTEEAPHEQATPEATAEQAPSEAAGDGAQAS